MIFCNVWAPRSPTGSPGHQAGSAFNGEASTMAVQLKDVAGGYLRTNLSSLVRFG
jgi:hypothetical protein